MFHEYPKWLGQDENGNHIIVESPEEESAYKAKAKKAEPKKGKE